MNTQPLPSRARTGDRGPRTGLGLVLLVLGSAAALGAVAAYWLNASTQVFGGLIALSLVTGAGLVSRAHGAMPDEPAVGEREPLASSAEERAAFVESFVAGEQSSGPPSTPGLPRSSSWSAHSARWHCPWCALWGPTLWRFSARRPGGRARGWFRAMEHR